MPELRLDREQMIEEVRTRGQTAALLRFGPLLFEVDELSLEPSASYAPRTAAADIQSASAAVGHGRGAHSAVLVYLPLVKRDRSDDPLLVGRAASCDVVVPAPTVSREHATMWFESGGAVIRDLGSTRGTFVDGKRIAPGAAMLIAPAKSFRMGDLHIRLVRLVDIV